MVGQIFRYIDDVTRLYSNNYLTFGKKLAICSAYTKIVAKRFFDGKIGNFRNEKFLGFKISFDSYNDFYWTFREVFVLGDYHFYTENPQPICIDCGGNIGVTTMYFKYIYPSAKVFTFEAEPHNVDLIKRNLKDSGITDVTVIGKAVGKEKCTVVFRGANRMGSIVEDLYEAKKGVQIKKGRVEIENQVEVEVVPLSEYMDEEHYDVLKMDIEGVEADVLEEINSHGILDKVDQVMLEYHRFSFDKNKLANIVKILEEHNYDMAFDSHFKRVTDMIGRKNYAFMIYALKNKLK